MKIAAVLVLCVAACSFEHGSFGRDDAGGDGRGVDGPPGCVSFSSQFDTCTTTTAQDLTLSGTNTFDTMTGKLLNGTTTVSVQAMQIAGKAGPIDVILVRNLLVTANAHLRAIGPVPFGVIAYGSITLATGALIDASSGGAGARMSCPAGPIIGAADSGGAGGGGGGGFGAAGGNGGTGNGDGTNAGGGTGGFAVTTKPDGPIGGCPGAKGGQGDDAGGNAGAAGGALYFASATQISIAAGAGINAGGGGGQGGRVSSFSNGDAGGGGGGAGGMIWIDAAMVRVAGTLAANGGGGGEASGGGGSGNDGTAGLLGVAAAPGGEGNSDSGTGGGSGGAVASPMGGTQTMILAGGGGGGGGGVGFIVVGSTDKMIATASPAPN